MTKSIYPEGNKSITSTVEDLKLLVQTAERILRPSSVKPTLRVIQGGRKDG